MRRRRFIEHLRGKFCISERRVCRAVGHVQSTQRYAVVTRDDEELLRSDIMRVASRHGRYGYRRVAVLLWNDGWRVNHKRVERIWRQEGLKGPKRQPKRAAGGG